MKDTLKHSDLELRIEKFSELKLFATDARMV